MFSEPVDDEQIIERVAALDIGKAELVCRVRLPGKTGSRRAQEAPRLKPGEEVAQTTAPPKDVVPGI